MKLSEVHGVRRVNNYSYLRQKLFLDFSTLRKYSHYGGKHNFSLFNRALHSTLNLRYLISNSQQYVNCFPSLKILWKLLQCSKSVQVEVSSLNTGDQFCKMACFYGSIATKIHEDQTKFQIWFLKIFERQDKVILPPISINKLHLSHPQFHEKYYLSLSH